MGFHGDRWIPTGYCLYGTTLAVRHKLITCSSAHLCEIFHIREPLLAIHPRGLMETIIPRKGRPNRPSSSPICTFSTFTFQNHTKATNYTVKVVSWLFFSMSLHPPVCLNCSFQCSSRAVWLHGVARCCPWALLNSSRAAQPPSNPAFLHLFPRQLTFKGAALVIDCLPFTGILLRPSVFVTSCHRGFAPGTNTLSVCRAWTCALKDFWPPSG